MEARKVPPRKDGRVIIHFDYDCFYASVFEAKNPSLRSLPFAVQQKQIIVTCNYEARRRGLHKLMLIKDAKRVCPDVIIELGEDISKFRDAIVMVERPPDFSGRDSDGDLVDLPDSQDRTQCASILSTLLSASLMDAIAERIDLPREQRYLLKLGAMCSSEGVLDWGLEVGTNYTTVVPSKYREELKKLLGMTEEPMWYLDFRQWHWREVRTRKGECSDGSYWFSSLILPSSCA